MLYICASFLRALWFGYITQYSAIILVQSISIPYTTGGPGPNPKEYQEDTAYSRQ